MAAGPFRRHRHTVGLLAALIAAAALIALALASSGSARARGSCFGQPATITGTNGADNIKLTANKDIVDARGGNDTIQAGSTRTSHGKDIICGGDGNDKITGNNEDNILIGGPGDDDIKGGPGDDLIVGDNANPKGTESGPTGSDTLNGTGGKDFVVGDNYASGNVTGASPDKDIVGLDANDTVIGDDASLNGNATGGANDRMAGADGNDLIVGDSYAPKGTASGSGDDNLNAGPGNDVEVGDNYTVSGRASGGGDDKLAGPDGGDFGVTCKPKDPCDDTFYGDNYVASCAPNSSPQAQASHAVIQCVAARGGPTGGVDLLTPDQNNDFMNGGPPDTGGPNGKDPDRCSGGSGIDTATRCTPIKTGAEHVIPYP
jgi:RTX calcium-binding nonapeptide repeat (4 copies)